MAPRAPQAMPDPSEMVAPQREDGQAQAASGSAGVGVPQQSPAAPMQPYLVCGRLRPPEQAGHLLAAGVSSNGDEQGVEASAVARPQRLGAPLLQHLSP